jgi:hypothetical protein
VDSCQNDGGLLNYLQFIYCTIPFRLIPLAMVVLFFWLIFLFIFLGATAEEYFCPALTVISKVLHLGQNVAISSHRISFVVVVAMSTSLSVMTLSNVYWAPIQKKISFLVRCPRVHQGNERFLITDSSPFRKAPQ